MLVRKRYEEENTVGWVTLQENRKVTLLDMTCINRHTWDKKVVTNKYGETGDDSEGTEEVEGDMLEVS